MVGPVHIWAYAFRVSLAALVALYVAFWLQLGGASSAAVTVAILAQPTRGAALAKAANRIAATLIGATMSVVIAGLFPGERIGMLGAFVCWICICVFVASYLRGCPMGAPRDIDLGGILVAPFVRYLFLALVILIAVRFVVGRLGLRSMFANPPLAEAALYVCILVSLVAFWI